MRQEQRSLPALPMRLLREEEFSAATFSKWSQKTFSETNLCGQRVRKTMSEGMGSGIPIKVAEDAISAKC